MCEECQKEPATVFVTRIVNGNKSEVHLCHRCAKERGEMAAPMEPGFAFHNILAGLFEPEATVAAPKRVSVRCSGCGMSLADFRRIGKLGCGQCYSEFERELEPLLKRVHRSVRHTGKTPHAMQDDTHALRRRLDELRTKLNEAISKEAYEEAAKLRDQIREAEAS